MDNHRGMAFMGIGFELVIMVLAATFLGQKIDDHFGWAGYATALLILMFLITWFYHLLILLRRSEKDD